MSKLRDLLQVDSVGGATGPKPTADPFFSRYGLGRNPFPPNRTILPEVLYNQDAAISRFAHVFRELLSVEPQRRSMAVLAGTGGGKTHFLRHCRWNVDDLLKDVDRRMLFVEFQAGAGKVQDIAREILMAADAVCQQIEEPDFVTALTRRASSVAVRALQQDDLKGALLTLVEASQPGYKAKDRAEVYTFETLRDVFRRWLSGGSLTQTERKYLGVISRIGTGSMTVRVLTECLNLARNLDLFEGLVLFLDEVETLFRGSASQYQSFLQDIRYLYDESVKNGRGYSLFTLTASTTYGATTLRQVNYPVFQRLGFEPDQRAELVPIGGPEEARRFADTYIDYERSRTQQRTPKRTAMFPPLLSDSEVESAYQAALGLTSAPGKGRVNQAPLLDALHALAERKRSER